MIMTEKFKILTEFIKDMSSETADVETYLFVKDQISKYHLDIKINSKPLKNKIIEVNTCLSFKDKELHEKKSHFEFVYTSIVEIDKSVKDKNDVEKIFNQRVYFKKISPRRTLICTKNFKRFLQRFFAPQN